MDRGAWRATVHRDTVAVELKYRLALSSSVRISDYEVCSCRSLNTELRIPVNITVSMSCYGDGLFPAGYERSDAFYQDGCPEYGTVKDRPDRSVRALPHRVQVILGHSLGIGCDRRALNCNTKLIGPVSIGPAVTRAQPPAFPRNPRGRLGFPGPTQGEG